MKPNESLHLPETDGKCRKEKTISQLWCPSSNNLTKPTNRVAGRRTAMCTRGKGERLGYVIIELQQLRGQDGRQERAAE